MASLAQRHQQRVRAGLAAAAAPAASQVEGTLYELMQAALFEHRRSLKAIQSVERKIEFKRSILDEYTPYVEGALASGNGAQDMVLTTLMVWHIDAGSYAMALRIAEYVLEHRLQLPDQYDRDAATLLMDEFSTAALAGRMDAPEDYTILCHVEHLTRAFDAPDQARAKLYKALGYAQICKLGKSDIDYDALPLGTAQAALEVLQRAFALYDQVGVKKDVERLERRIKKLQEPNGA